MVEDAMAPATPRTFARQSHNKHQCVRHAFVSLEEKLNIG